MDIGTANGVVTDEVTALWSTDSLMSIISVNIFNVYRMTPRWFAR